MMLYSLGDKFVVQDVFCQVVYINQNKAWVSPLEDGPLQNGQHCYRGQTFEVIDEKGRDSKGKKVISVTNNTGAV